MKKICLQGFFGILTLLLLLLPAYFFRHKLAEQPWRVSRYFQSIALSETRVGIFLPDSDLFITREDGLNIAASLYGIKTPQKRPGILIIHGNTPLGRNLALYKVLAKTLSEKGYVVLTIDLPGFGETEDPFELDNKEPSDPVKGKEKSNTVRAAINYFKELDTVNDERIFVIGHSGGAMAALSAGIKEPLIKKIVLIGPPRRVKERSLSNTELDYFWERAKETRMRVHNKPFPDSYTKEMFQKSFSSGGISAFLTYLTDPRHKPVMLIDGEKEGRSDKLFLRDIYSEMLEPKNMITLKRSDHYSNILGIFKLQFYDKGVLSETIDEIDKWLSESTVTISPALSNQPQTNQRA